MGKLLEKPFIPSSKVSLVMLDGRVDDYVKQNFCDASIDVIEVLPCFDLYEAISCHPDIQCHPVGKNRIVVAPNANESLKNQLIHHGFEIVVGNTRLEGNYPNNIAYNVARIGDVALHNTAYTDPVLKEELLRQGVRFIHVKQGYTKCSVAIIGENALITADKGIAAAAEKYGLDVLQINPGFIALRDMNYGFIGGSCGLTGEDELTFIGDVGLHPDYLRIVEFAAKYEKKINTLKDMCLSDYGSIIPLKQID